MWRYSGSKLHNLRVHIWPYRMLVQGSLAKFHLGSNIETLSREETARAIEHLSDELNQRMAEAKVSRLDVAKTFVMERPPSDYWRCFLPPPRMNRLDYRNGTLTYFNAQRSIVFYDKFAEIQRKGARSGNEGLSRFTDHPNLLRYEVQFKHRLGQVFGERDIRAARLSHPAFYEKVVRKWAAQYFELVRVSSFQRPVGRTTVRSEVAFLAALGLRTFGPQQYLDGITSDLRAGLIDKYQANRKRTKILELLRPGGVPEAGDVLGELAAKVRLAVALSK